MNILLSESIKLGATYGRQLYGKLGHIDGGTCAMGAAMLASRGKQVTIGVFAIEGYCGFSNAFHIDRIFQSLDWMATTPDSKVMSVWSAIVHCNNELRMTWEQIADWIVANGYDCEAVLPAPVEVAEVLA